jgi:hypothetical protein
VSTNPEQLDREFSAAYFLDHSDRGENVPSGAATGDDQAHRCIWMD